jgi:hypothetical protein
MSEIYEYALRIDNPQAVCVGLQPFKMVYAYLLAGDMNLGEDMKLDK